MNQTIHLSDPNPDPYPDAYQHWLRDQEIAEQELRAELEWLKANPDPFDSDDNND